ncbi:MAG: hypothetical protein ACXAB9_13030 [Candidatus Thorarchaeota archaeon]|jgi:hypothetical protein
MKLPHEVEKTFVVQVEDLEKLISEHYGVQFNFMQVADPFSEGDCTFVVEQNYDRTSSFIKNGKFVSWSTNDVLDDLAGKGLIEEGNYYIEANL